MASSQDAPMLASLQGAATFPPAPYGPSGKASSDSSWQYVQPSQQALTCPPTTTNPLEASSTSLTLEKRTLQFGPTGDQLSYVQNQVALLEATLASQSREAEQYIQNQRGQTHAVLLQQRVEFETQARGLRGVPHCGGMLFAYAFAPLDISPEGYFVRGQGDVSHGWHVGSRVLTLGAQALPRAKLR